MVSEVFFSLVKQYTCPEPWVKHGQQSDIEGKAGQSQKQSLQGNLNL
jgi:hypothetical protein